MEGLVRELLLELLALGDVASVEHDARDVGVVEQARGEHLGVAPGAVAVRMRSSAATFVPWRVRRRVDQRRRARHGRRGGPGRSTTCRRRASLSWPRTRSIDGLWYVIVPSPSTTVITSLLFCTSERNRLLAAIELGGAFADALLEVRREREVLEQHRHLADHGEQQKRQRVPSEEAPEPVAEGEAEPRRERRRAGRARTARAPRTDRERRRRRSAVPGSVGPHGRRGRSLRTRRTSRCRSGCPTSTNRCS